MGALTWSGRVAIRGGDASFAAALEKVVAEMRYDFIHNPRFSAQPPGGTI